MATEYCRTGGRRHWLTVVGLVVALLAAGLSGSSRAAEAAVLTLSPGRASCGTPVDARGQHFIPGTSITIFISRVPGDDVLAVDAGRVAEDGRFVAQLPVEQFLPGCNGAPPPPPESNGQQFRVVAATGRGPKYADDWRDPTAAASLTFAMTPAELFRAVWWRTDQPTLQGDVNRTWIWGAAPVSDDSYEAYAESPGGLRIVRYYDKSRMELTHPDALDEGLWHVTNGLLVTELVTGQLQVGDARFELRWPAAINIAGDPGSGPSYAALGPLLDALPAADGQVLTVRIDALGQVTDDPSVANMGVTAAQRVQAPGIDHQVASVFWEFMNSSGLVYQAAGYMTAQLFQNPFYATGYPLTEAYWATVAVAGEPRDVLVQCFERRCLTYTPTNPAGWQVEAGNVGQHYYQWRYTARAGSRLVPARSGVVALLS